MHKCLWLLLAGLAAGPVLAAEPADATATVGRLAWEKTHPERKGPYVSPMRRDPATVTYAGLPAELMGKYPIAMPKYEGVDQLLLLSSRWVIVAVRDLDEVIAKTNELSGGALLKAEDDWTASEAAGRPNWTAYKGRATIRDQFIAKAREAVGERRMDEPAFFTIASTDDAAYRSGRQPARVTRNLVPLNGKQVRGSHDVDYAHYCYLEMPSPLVNGKTYSIRLGNGKAVTFLYDELASVSRAIKVNQVGYAPDAGRKYAYVGCYLWEFGPMDLSAAKSFRVINVATGATALSGELKLRERDPRFRQPDPKPGTAPNPNPGERICGEDVYELDLSSLKDTGVFFISIPGVGRSWPFRHSPDVYGEIFYTTMRGFFHQRAAQPLAQPYTAWTRRAFHTEPVYESGLICGPRQGGGPEDKGLDRFDVVGATLDFGKVHEHVDGGWYDAADWDRNTCHLIVVFDLLTAYEFAPAKFTDGQLNIPESGNGIPDLLDEVEYGLRVWKHGQTAEGGIGGMLETWTHPAIDANVPYGFARPTRWDSLAYAAAAAQFAQNVKPFSAKLAAEYQDSALRAYAFGTNPRNSLGKIHIEARKLRGAGAPYTLAWEEKDEMSFPYLVHAKLRFFALTGDASYLDGIGDLAKRAYPPMSWRFSHKDWSIWMYAGLMTGPAVAKLPPDVTTYWREGLTRPVASDGNATDGRIWTGPNELRWADDMPYRFSWPRVRGSMIGWGDSTTTNTSRGLFLAYLASKDRKYLDTMYLNSDFAFGANPLGMSWTTGVGWVYPVVFQHAFSNDDGIRDPVPGITVYGITAGGRFADFRNNVWSSPVPGGKPLSFVKPANTEVPVWRRWAAHPMVNTAQCEFTVSETMSGVAFTAALLLPPDWQPSEALKKRQPREDQYLFGYWYLP